MTQSRAKIIKASILGLIILGSTGSASAADLTCKTLKTANAADRAQAVQRTSLFLMGANWGWIAACNRATDHGPLKAKLAARCALILGKSGERDRVLDNPEPEMAAICRNEVQDWTMAQVAQLITFKLGY